MTATGFLLRVVAGVFAFAGFVLALALFQHWIERRMQ